MDLEHSMSTCTDCGRPGASILVSLPNYGDPITYVCAECAKYVPLRVWMPSREVATDG